MKVNANEYIGKNVYVKVDRPIGSSHPNYPDHIYLVNYGFVPNTISGDGEELDCYILGEKKPIKEYTGKCIAVIHRLNDDDDKLIITSKGRNFTNKEIDVVIEFQEKFYKHEIIRKDIEFNSLIPELSVSNIEISKMFYENLGFKIVYERPENRICFMQLENNQIMIEEKNDNWSVGKLEYPYGNGINISMSVNNIECLYENLKDKKIQFFLELKINEYRVNNKTFQDKEFLIQDPDGYLLRFNN